MKKLDKLILNSFLGPFILTFLVVVFILLTQYMMKYFEDFVGKDLGAGVFAELLGYFSINMTPVAFPLAVLLSSLITFGNLGEHFELTAIKSAGISLTRVLLPIFIFVVFLSVLAFVNNDQIVPRANIKAYALLYDIRQTKPSLDLKEGAFYNGIPGYSIKVNKKFNDGETLKDIIIYNHTKDGGGNSDVILADSGKMYTILNDRYMMLELFDGKSFNESKNENAGRRAGDDINDFVRSEFDKSKIVFSLSSFEMQRTKEELFAHNRMMKNINQLQSDIDSMGRDVNKTRYDLFLGLGRYYNYHMSGQPALPADLFEFVKQDSALLASYEHLANPNPEALRTEIPADGVETPKTKEEPIKQIKEFKKKQIADKVGAIMLDVDTLKRKEPLSDTEIIALVEAKNDTEAEKKKVLKTATDRARYVMNNVKSQATRIRDRQSEMRVYEIEAKKKYSQAVACIIMFLIGAPLGAIIKRGGLGVPVLLSIIFFIVYYVFSMIGEKWAKSGAIDVDTGVWAANVLLLPLGLLFLRQARRDARLFESDFYAVLIERFRKRLGEKNS
ncbi:LptF/LptG family permease [Cytophagales bacterium LB-30]|uniref:LptF/LptG family permease n=1 Tax=Shiella aurantiaca TaxID=3058365 RepID=A0ABT8F4M0_9BACT|nr:LptF/LptG family permease [Shiella aurantiaca]MDN4165391.1 LptF/LptG family permease [Shiella aurantiaca]